MRREIRFYRTRDPFGCFSNFSKHPIELDGKIWDTTEHYFQAKKFEGHPDEEEVRLTPTPMQAAKMGRERSRPLRSDWENVKEDIMLAALKAKFTQYPDLQEVLLETGDAFLIEHTANDSYWGNGGDDSGKNRLGHLLMQLREELQENENA